MAVKKTKLVKTAEDLWKAIVKFREVKDGDSGDEEHDAAIDMMNCAEEYLLASCGKEMTELADMYGFIIDEMDEEKE